MTDRENFLERWSRKKVETEREATDAPGQSPAAADLPEKNQAEAAPEQQAEPPASTPPAPAPPKPEFDLASLPSLESITSGTDIRAFLSPGVPAELTRAALRRAWVADPAIRDFVGLAENSWDFTDPAAIPGFGEIPPGYDIKKMIAQIFGEADPTIEQRVTPDDLNTPPAKPQATAVAAETPSADSSGEVDEISKTGQSTQSAGGAGTTEEPPETNFVQRNSNAALQQGIPEVPSTDTKHRRRHGGALPQS